MYTRLYNLGSEERCQQLEGNVKSTKRFFWFAFNKHYLNACGNDLVRRG